MISLKFYLLASKGSTVALPFHKRLAIKTIDHSAQTKPGLAELRCRPSWLSLSDATQSTNLAWPRCYVGLAGFGQSTRQSGLMCGLLIDV
jgi:hypothetical protein